MSEEQIYGVYIRVSTDQQFSQGDSVEMQTNLAKEFVKKNGGVIYGEPYIEGGVSASKTKLKDRKKLMECLNDAKTGLFNNLIVYKRDRLARKTEDSLAIRSMLESANCSIHFTASGEQQMDLNDPYSKLMENIRSSLDEIESAQISVRVGDTMFDKAKRGEFSGGNVTYGYQNNDGMLTPIESEIPIIKEVEDLYMEGYGKYSIAKWLEGQSIRGRGKRHSRATKLKQHKRSSEKWTIDNIDAILFNKTYSGYLLYRKKNTDGEFETICVKSDQIESIRSEDTQNKIDLIRKQRNESRMPARRYNTSFLLTGILVCGECGQEYASRTVTKKNGKRYSYYVCKGRSGNHKVHTCKSKAYKREILEQFVLEEAKMYLRNFIDSNSHAKIKEGLEEKDETLSYQLDEVARQLSKAQKDFQSISRLLLDLDTEDDMYEMMKEMYQEQQKEVLLKMNNLKKSKEKIKDELDVQVEEEININDVIDQLKDFNKIIEHAPTHTQKQLLENLFSKIEIDGKGNVSYSLTFSIEGNSATVGFGSVGEVKDDEENGVMFIGGVGDTTTLVLAPLVASLGVPLAKMSGRGLGHTGGTIDKLESVPGFHVEITNDEFIELVNKNKVAVVGQSGNLTPADKKIYSLRDVTATVNSIPLIASSIMSKKIASGADAIVLDVKTGAGAFMKELGDAKALAEAMVSIGNQVNRKTMSVISDMTQPLGHAIGNALEIKEAIDTLQDKGPEDLTELCLTLGSQMVVLAEKAGSIEEARTVLRENLTNGKAFEHFKTFIRSQGGDANVVDNPELLPQAAYQVELPAMSSGTVANIIANDMGTAAMMLGAGRADKDSSIDLAVGIVLHKKIGDPVKKGESLLTIHANREAIEEVKEKLYESIEVSDSVVQAPTLIYDTITKK